MVTLSFDSNDYTSIRTYKWKKKGKKKGKKWVEVRYQATFDDSLQMSFKKRGKYRVVGVNVLTDERQVLAQFRVRKDKSQ